MIEDKIPLTFENVFSEVKGDFQKRFISENRVDAFYMVAQLLARGSATKKQLKELGQVCVESLERDEWWRSNGAFQDD